VVQLIRGVRDKDRYTLVIGHREKRLMMETMVDPVPIDGSKGRSSSQTLIEGLADYEVNG
jgi:hypothetical protein